MMVLFLRKKSEFYSKIVPEKLVTRQDVQLSDGRAA